MIKKFYFLQVGFLLFFIASCSNTPDPIGSKDASQGYQIGDVVYKDGTSDSLITNSDVVLQNKDKVIAIIFKPTSQNSKALGVGIDFSLSGLSWCTLNCSLANDKACPTICAYIQDINNDTVTLNTNISNCGIASGVNAVELLAGRLSSSPEKIIQKFPAFEFCYNYKNYCSRICGTAYEDGWYLPSVIELYDIKRMKNTGLTSISFCLNQIRGDYSANKVTESYTLSCSAATENDNLQTPDYRESAYAVHLYGGAITRVNKTSTDYVVLPVREF